MKPGDHVKLTTHKGVFEGSVLPRSELADQEHIVLKLNTGYNIGLAKSDIQKMELVSFSKSKRKTTPIKFSKDKPLISIVATGGTITSKVDYETGGVTSLASADELLQTAPQLAEFVKISDIVSPFRIMSEDMGIAGWQKLATVVANELNKDNQGVIVTHGTDTLHYTSAALSFMLPNLSKPIAVVGAQRSVDRGSFDGTMNLLCGAHYCLSDIAETAIVMHGTTSDDYCIASRGTKVRKMHTSRRDAFRPINEMPLAKIFPDGNVVIENTNYTQRSNGKITADTAFEEKTGLVKIHPGISPNLVDFYIDQKYRGLILEATAFGHVPTYTLRKENSWVSVVKKAIDAGLFVGVTSQCVYGRTSSTVYTNLRVLAETGAVHLEDMLPETAFVKLGWVLGHEKKHEKVRELMLTNLRGEINTRIDPESYLY